MTSNQKFLNTPENLWPRISSTKSHQNLSNYRRSVFSVFEQWPHMTLDNLWPKVLNIPIASPPYRWPWTPRHDWDALQFWPWLGPWISTWPRGSGEGVNPALQNWFADNCQTKCYFNDHLWWILACFWKPTPLSRKSLQTLNYGGWGVDYLPPIFLKNHTNEWPEGSRYRDIIWLLRKKGNS